MNSTTLNNVELTSLTNATLYDAAIRKTTGDVVIEPGSVLLDLYRVESEPIKGGMGVVWRVHHIGWNTDLAMKQPQATLFQSEEHKLSFIDECAKWIKLGLHPYVVSCHYVREVGGVFSIFSEWMDGGSLKNQIDSGALYEGSDVLKRILDIAIQSARGLHYAHQHELIHQDVKPDNLLLTRTGEAKVTDFGVARSRSFRTKTKAASTTQIGDGTMYAKFGGFTRTYCSPEQARGEQNLTRRTDIYSWAVSVLEMFLGFCPWEKSSGSIVGESFDNYLAMEMHIAMPEALQDLLRHCLRPKPDDRPHDFEEVETTLLTIYETETGNPYPNEKIKAVAETADSLNNHALSYLDLGKPKKAAACWEKALMITPNHAETIYNQSVYLWEHGEMDDIDVLNRLIANTSVNTEYYLAQIHMARGDYYNAIEHLQKVQETFDEPDKIDRMLCQLRQTQTETKYSEDVINRPPDDASHKMLIDTSNGKPFAAFMLSDGDEIEAIRICPDEKTVVAIIGGKKKRKVIEYWDIETATKIFTVRTKAKDRFLAFSPDSKTMLTCVYSIFQPLIQQWNIVTGACVKSFRVREKRFCPYVACFSADGKTVLCGEGNALRGFDLATGKCTFSHKEKEFFISAIAFNPDGKTVIIGDDEGMMKLVNLDNGSCMRMFHGTHKEMIQSISFSPDCKTAISAGWDAKIWNASKGQCIRTFNPNHGYYPNAFSFNGDGKMIAVLYFRHNSTRSLKTGNNMIKLYTLPEFQSCEPMRSRISQSDQTYKAMVIFNTIASHVKDKLKKRDIHAAMEQIDKLAKIPSWGVSTEYYNIRKEVARYCIKTGLVVYHTRLFRDHQCENIVISRTGEKALLYNRNNSVLLIDIGTGKRIGTLEKHKSDIISAAFSADEKTALLGCKDRTVIMWDTVTGEHIRSFCKIRNFGKLGDVCMSPNKKIVLLSQERSMVDACISPDGKSAIKQKRLAIQLWDISSRRCIRDLDGFGIRLEATSFSPDGSKLIAGGSEGVIVYDLDYKLTFPGWKDWDDGALPYLQNFLNLHPNYTEEDFQDLIIELQNRGYGWLRPLGVRTKLGWKDWNDSALPYLQAFLTLHPDYTEEDFQNLITELQNRGYGWLRPLGVRTKLDELQFGW